MEKEIKKRIYAYRNGVVADVLRKAGMPYKYIFGLQLPQLVEISKEFLHDRENAHAAGLELWKDSENREARLTATLLINPEIISEEEVLELCSTLKTREEAEIIALKLLKRLSFASILADQLESNPGTLQRYCGNLLKNHIS